MTDWCFVVSRPKNKYSEVIAIRMIEPFSLRIMGSQKQSCTSIQNRGVRLIRRRGCKKILMALKCCGKSQFKSTKTKFQNSKHKNTKCFAGIMNLLIQMRSENTFWEEILNTKTKMSKNTKYSLNQIGALQVQHQLVNANSKIQNCKCERCKKNTNCS